MLGAGTLREIFDARYYGDLPGGLLESFGRLFQGDMQLFVYPLLERAGCEPITVGNLDVPDEMAGLFRHLVDTHRILPLETAREDVLPIFSREVLRKIEAGDESWTEMVPEAVARVIRQRGFFGYEEKLED